MACWACWSEVLVLVLPAVVLILVLVLAVVVVVVNGCKLGTTSIRVSDKWDDVGILKRREEYSDGLSIDSDLSDDDEDDCIGRPPAAAGDC